MRDAGAQLRFVVAARVFLVIPGLLLGLGMATVKAVLLAPSELGLKLMPIGVSTPQAVGG